MFSHSSSYSLLRVLLLQQSFDFPRDQLDNGSELALSGRLLFFHVCVVEASNVRSSSVFQQTRML